MICVDKICNELKNSNQEWEKFGTPMSTFRGFINSDKNMTKLYDALKLNTYIFSEKFIHRLIIWSFAKEKILNKPVFGNGWSKHLGEQTSVIDINNQILPAIPLHPHNGVMQIWLELGFLVY